MLIERLLKVALLGSEWVLYLLIILSVVSIATMLDRWIYFARRSDNLDRLRQDLSRHLHAEDLPGVIARLEASRSNEALIIRKALRWVAGGAEAFSDAVESELGRTKKELERGLNLLGTLGNNAPFIGLLGTVLGVIISFKALGNTGQNSGAMGDVMSGISEALVATGVGLAVALPAVVAYNIAQKRIGDIEVDTISLAKLVTASLKAYPGLLLTPVASDEVPSEAAAEDERNAASLSTKDASAVGAA
jgi:biopolymer transport protein ExbB/TolQ